MDYYESIKRFGLLLESVEVTPDMKEHFIKRQENHNAMVKKNLDRLIQKYTRGRGAWPLQDKIEKRARIHDASKFKSPEMDPYILVTWSYKARDEGFDFKVDDETQRDMSNAKFHHVKTNDHHPEYWDKSLTKNPFVGSGKDKAVSFGKVDGTKMPMDAIVEMVADWKATGDELGNSAKSWADKVIGTRFEFTDDQKDLIYKTISDLEGEGSER